MIFRPNISYRCSTWNRHAVLRLWKPRKTWISFVVINYLKPERICATQFSQEFNHCHLSNVTCHSFRIISFIGVCAVGYSTDCSLSNVHAPVHIHCGSSVVLSALCTVQWNDHSTIGPYTLYDQPYRPTVRDTGANDIWFGQYTNRAFSYWRHIYCGAVALPSLITSNRVSNVNIKQQQGVELCFRSRLRRKRSLAQ